MLPAFLVELAFYLALGFERVRKRFEQAGSQTLRAALLTSSAIIPYLLESTGTHTFSFRWFAVLVIAASIASFWYARKQRGIFSDLMFLAVIGIVYLSRAFPYIYGKLTPHVAIDILGRLMWIRVTIMAVLSIRGRSEARFGFLPSSSEWRTGVEYFLYFLPVGGLVAYLIRFAQFRPMPVVWWKFPLFAIGIFLGCLWVVALFEEFVFRGFLQQLIARGVRNEAIGVIAASILFGLVHVLAPPFPNWRFAAVAGIAGIFYGIAFLKANSVRASMVTHALVVTTWRVFFSR